jgi:hypothetical protein
MLLTQKSKIILIILTVLLVLTVGTIAFFGYNTSIQNQKQINEEGLNIVQQEINKNTENFPNEIPNLNNITNQPQQIANEPVRNYTEIEIDDSLNSQIPNLEIDFSSGTNQNYKIETRVGTILEEDESYSSFARTGGVGILNQNTKIQSEQKHFLKNEQGEYFFIGYDLLLIKQIKVENENYWFFISSDLFGTPSLYFATKNFSQTKKVQNPFQGLLLRDVKNQENSDLITLELVNGNGRNVQTETKKIDIKALFMENKPF